jgi:hypothetical protein|tara:strand:+ start:99 stop:335 length:237 start_codon:yes stop_codon:yes gene_type:complete
MCLFGGGPTQPKVEKYQSKNDPVLITGEQEGLEDTKKKSEADSLKIGKQVAKKEARNLSNSTIATAQKLTQTKKKTLI